MNASLTAHRNFDRRFYFGAVMTGAITPHA
jgi:hypothetical protein